MHKSSGPCPVRERLPAGRRGILYFLLDLTVSSHSPVLIFFSIRRRVLEFK
jgi:hypothetical protein